MGQRRDELDVWLALADETLSEYVESTYHQSAEYLTSNDVRRASRPWD